MAIETIHSFLVHPAKNVDDQPDISGTVVPRQGGLFDLLNDVYERAPDECNIAVVFRPDNNGDQRNECRDALLGYTQAPTIAAGRSIAQRLQEVTTHRSGLGLLFLLKGEDDAGRHSLVVSRFPADQGIVAREDNLRLTVEFIEQVFMRNARSYKSAFYRTDALAAGFWEGQAVDRQISGARDLSEYWIGDFLQSELRTTGPAGTRRLVVAIRDAVRKTSSLAVKQELVAATHLLRGQAGRTQSARTLMRRIGFTEEAERAVIESFPRRELLTENFRFSVDELDRQALYHTVELDNGALLTAETESFPEVFEREPMVAEGTVRYSTEGRVVDERIRKTK